MGRELIQKLIEEKIRILKPGEIIVTADFTDVASSDTASRALLRLSDSGFIRRVLRGVYEHPQYSDLLKEYVAPSPDKIAHALARNYGWTIVPSGDTALNFLGLSTQVPAAWLYVSDGPYKKYAFDRITLKFKHTANKEISKVSYITALVIQALKALGKEMLTDGVIKALSLTLTETEKQTMLKEAKYTTSWIYDAIKVICAREQS